MGYIKKLSNLRVDRKSRYSSGKAPHKPVLLIALIKLHQNGKMDLRHITPTTYLRETWAQLWEHLDYPKPGSLHLPLYHMCSEGFWNIMLRPGNSSHPPRSLKAFVEMVDHVSADEGFIGVVEDEKRRNEAINALLNGGYFSDVEIDRLAKALQDFDSSFEYEEKVVSNIKEEFRMEGDPFDFKEVTRNPAFRRVSWLAVKYLALFAG